MIKLLRSAGPLVALWSCTAVTDSVPSVEPVPVVAISLPVADFSLRVGDSQVVSATVTGTANRAVRWSTAQPEIVRVTSEGLVTGVAVGTASLLATSVADPTKTTTATISVRPAVSVALVPTTLTLDIGSTRTLVAQVSGSTDGSVSWRSGAPAIATVTIDGQVTGVSAGSATITATSITDTTKSAAVRVLVVEPLTVRLDVRSLILRVGETKSAGLLVRGGDGLNSAVQWRSSSDGLVRISKEGMFTGVSGGVARVYAIAVADTTRRDSIDVQVRGTPYRDSTVVMARPGGGVFAAHLSGHRLLARRAADGTLVATWIVPGGRSMTVWSDDRGRPARAMLGDALVFFANYRSDTADVAIHINGDVRVARDVVVPRAIFAAWNRTTFGAPGGIPFAVRARLAGAAVADEPFPLLNWASIVVGWTNCVLAGGAVVAAPAGGAFIFWIPAVACASTAVTTWNALTATDNGALTASAGAADALFGTYTDCIAGMSPYACVGQLIQLADAFDAYALQWLIKQDPSFAVIFAMLRRKPPEKGEVTMYLRGDLICGCPIGAGELGRIFAIVNGTMNAAVSWSISDETIASLLFPSPPAPDPQQPAIRAAGPWRGMSTENQLAATVASASLFSSTGALNPGATLTPETIVPVIVAGRRSGTFVVTAQSQADPSVRSTTEALSVVGASGISVSGHSHSMPPGYIMPLVARAEGLPSNTVLSWRSSDPTVATVSGTGVVRTHREGNAVVSVRASSAPTVAASFELSVRDRTIKLQNRGPCRLIGSALGQERVVSVGEEVGFPASTSGILGVRSAESSARSCTYVVWGSYPDLGFSLTRATQIQGFHNQTVEAGQVVAYPFYLYNR